MKTDLIVAEFDKINASVKSVVTTDRNVYTAFEYFTRLWHLISSNDMDFSRLGAAILDNAELTERMTRLKNSSFYQLSKLHEMKLIIAYLGTEETRKVISKYFRDRLIRGSRDEFMRIVQEESIAVALTCQTLDRYLSKKKRTNAQYYLLGLFHNLIDVILYNYRRKEFDEIIQLANRYANVSVEFIAESILGQDLFTITSYYLYTIDSIDLYLPIFFQRDQERIKDLLRLDPALFRSSAILLVSRYLANKHFINMSRDKAHSRYKAFYCKFDKLEIEVLKGFLKMDEEKFIRHEEGDILNALNQELQGITSI